MVVCRSVSSDTAVMAVRLSFEEKQLLLLYRLYLPSAPATPVSSSTAGVAAAAPVLTHLRTLYPPQHQLVDMELTCEHVWTLWTDSNNDNQVGCCCLAPVRLSEQTRSP